MSFNLYTRVMWITYHHHYSTGVFWSCLYIYLYQCVAYFYVTCYHLFFLAWRTFSVSCKAGLMVMNSLSFCFGKSLSHLHFWRTAMLGKVLCLAVFFFFITLTISSHSFLACKNFAAKSIGSFIKVPLYKRIVFLLLLLQSSLSLILDSFILMYPGEGSFGIEILGWLISFINLDVQISPQVWEVLSHCYF